MFKDHKEGTDAESLMPFPTSDLRNPICLEMRLLRSGAAFGIGEPTSILSSGAAVDIGSIDSSDTYASCNTQPFNSQGDLTEDSNLYVNPLTEASQAQSSVKKSASGDTALRSLGASPIDETYKGFAGAQERGSRGSLNEAPLPKHRKTRFQQVKLRDVYFLSDLIICQDCGLYKIESSSVTNIIS
jgi:hypothetical protein